MTYQRTYPHVHLRRPQVFPTCSPANVTVNGLRNTPRAPGIPLPGNYSPGPPYQVVSSLEGGCCFPAPKGQKAPRCYLDCVAFVSAVVVVRM